MREFEEPKTLRDWILRSVRGGGSIFELEHDQRTMNRNGAWPKEWATNIKAEVNVMAALELITLENGLINPAARRSATKRVAQKSLF